MIGVRRAGRHPAPAYPQWLGGTGALLSIGSAGLWFFYERRDPVAALHAAGLAFALLAMALAQQFEGRVVVIAWAVEGGVAAWVGVRAGNLPFRAGGLALLGLAAARLADGFMPALAAGGVLWNDRTAATAVVVLTCYALAWHWRREPALAAERLVPLALHALASGLTLVWLSAEVDAYWLAGGDVRARLARELSRSLAWGAYGSLLIVVGLWRSIVSLRWIGILTIGLTVLKVFFVDLSALGGIYRVVGFLVLGVLLVAVSYSTSADATAHLRREAGLQQDPVEDARVGNQGLLGHGVVEALEALRIHVRCRRTTAGGATSTRRPASASRVTSSRNSRVRRLAQRRPGIVTDGQVVHGGIGCGVAHVAGQHRHVVQPAPVVVVGDRPVGDEDDGLAVGRRADGPARSTRMAPTSGCRLRADVMRTGTGLVTGVVGSAQVCRCARRGWRGWRGPRCRVGKRPHAASGPSWRRWRGRPAPRTQPEQELRRGDDRTPRRDEERHGDNLRHAGGNETVDRRLDRGARGHPERHFDRRAPARVGGNPIDALVPLGRAAVGHQQDAGPPLGGGGLGRRGPGGECEQARQQQGTKHLRESPWLVSRQAARSTAMAG